MKKTKRHSDKNTCDIMVAIVSYQGDYGKTTTGVCAIDTPYYMDETGDGLLSQFLKSDIKVIDFHYFPAVPKGKTYVTNLTKEMSYNSSTGSKTFHPKYLKEILTLLRRDIAKRKWYHTESTDFKASQQYKVQDII